MRVTSASRTARAVAALVVLVVSALVMSAAPAAAGVEEDPGTDTEVTTTGDGRAGGPVGSGRVLLVDVPPGCSDPELPDIVFVGTVVERDFRTVRFRILQVRAGDADEFSVDELIDVRYGLDVQFLDPGVDYLVSAQRDPLIGVLYSRLRDPAPAFGGDDVVGIDGAEVDCPVWDDPVRTMFPDGSEVQTSVFAPMFADRSALITAMLIPVGVALALIFVLAMLRLGVSGVARGVRAALRPRAVGSR